jgi:choline-sulfatase
MMCWLMAAGRLPSRKPGRKPGRKQCSAVRNGLRAARLIALVAATGCSNASPPPVAPTYARNLILITIDTLRADRVGTYGYPSARTPRIDALAAKGVKFDAAYATAPITLTSHASLLSGLYPPGHGARHNGMAVQSNTPTLATILSGAGFATGGFVGAFPLDRRFGLNRGFGTYGDRMPRGDRGLVSNERPGRVVVDEALQWLNAQKGRRVFLWVHLFEPHAPYGDPRTGRSGADRYDDEVAETDVQVGRIVDALGADAAASLIVVASDHGEAFGEHGEITHSLFVYDTTLRVPVIMNGAGIPPSVVNPPISLVDVVPTVLPLLGLKGPSGDGIDLGPAMRGAAISDRELYAESFAPLFDFGWSPLRTIRSRGFKFIEAPRAELYELSRDPGEALNLAAEQGPRVAELRDRVERYPPPAIDKTATDPEALARLQALGYLSGRGSTTAGVRPDPKDRRDVAERMARVASGELDGPVLQDALEQILREDPRNPQANLRLGYLLIESKNCSAARPYLTAAIAGHVPGVDAHLGLALCSAAARRFGEAAATLKTAARLEPQNPVVLANLGIVLSDDGRHGEGIRPLQRALEIDPDFDEARFNLARVFARDGRRADAAREVKELLARMPANAPQRGEVERLLRTVE